MDFACNGKFLRVNLSDGTLESEPVDEALWRRFGGGWGLVGYFLLRETAPGLDPLGPRNPLIFATGVLTGCRIPGSGRHSVGAKSPLTGGFGTAEAGGYWGAELKRTGFDGVIIEGQSSDPVYLYIHDGEAELRDASDLWGKTTGEAHKFLLSVLGKQAHTALIGQAGENLVPYASIIHDLGHVAGRTGLGAVMGSKRLKAICVQGAKGISVADSDEIKKIAQWLAQNLEALCGWRKDLGTSALVLVYDALGGLPTRNFREGSFEEAEGISGEKLRDEYLVGRKSCYGCPIKCKRVVSIRDRYTVDPMYGGPEYETIVALGANCGIGDLQAVAKANELCAAYGLDTISTGVTVAWAMECAEQGLLPEAKAEGLCFGNKDAMLGIIPKIAKREGLGYLLSKGAYRAAGLIGSGAEHYAMHVKGQELPMHEPRLKRALGLGYIASPTGADHNHNAHDNAYVAPGPFLDMMTTLGIQGPIPLESLGTEKLRVLHYQTLWMMAHNCLGICQFLPYSYEQIQQAVKAATSWDTSIWELMKIGERAFNMGQAFNVIQGLDPDLDVLPKRFFEPLEGGTLCGGAIDSGIFRKALGEYYELIGWDPITHIPSRGKLRELGLDWVINLLPK